MFTIRDDEECATVSPPGSGRFAETDIGPSRSRQIDMRLLAFTRSEYAAAVFEDGFPSVRNGKSWEALVGSAAAQPLADDPV